MNPRTTALATLLVISTTQIAVVRAEHIDCSGSKKTLRETSHEAIKPGDVPGRELVQFVRIDLLSTKDKDSDGVEETVYGHLDHIGGTGAHSGYSVRTTKSGDKIWSQWQGAHYLVPKDDGKWELPYLGTYRFIAGTGKYKGIRGGGSYRGTVTPAGQTEEFSCAADL